MSGAVSSIETQTTDSQHRPDLLRLQLIDQGWRSLTDASDPRRKAAAEGAAATICYWPQFRELGVPTAMVKDGDISAPDGAVWRDLYIRQGSSWIVQN